MYCMIISSVMAPEVVAKYPRLQKWRPQNCLLSFGFSMRSFRDVLPLINCAILDTEICGGIEMNRWTWSEDTWPRMICTFSVRQISRTKSRRRWPRRPVRTGLRYLVVQTRWYLRSKTVWGPLRYSFMRAVYQLERTA